MFETYKTYIKDNPHRYWFKRKLYGWGWTPATWEGWVTLFVYIGLVLAFAFTIDDRSPIREVMFTFVFPLVILTSLLIRIAYKKGETPGWQWGITDTKQNKKK